MSLGESEGTHPIACNRMGGPIIGLVRFEFYHQTSRLQAQ